MSPRSRWFFVGLLGAALALCPSLDARAGAEAATWTVTLQVTLENVRYQTQFQVDVTDPVGVTAVNVLGLPGAVVRNQTTLSVSLSSVPPGTPGCVDTRFVVGGTGPIQPSGSGFTASGEFDGGKITNGCSTQVQVFEINGVFFARSAGAVAPPPPTTEAVSGTVTLKTPFGSQPLLSGTGVAAGSLLQTAADGNATVTFVDGTRLIVGASAQVALLPPTHPTGDDIVLSQIRGLLTHKVAAGSVSQPDR